MKARIYKDQWGIQILCDGAFCYDLDSEEQLNSGDVYVTFNINSNDAQIIKQNSALELNKLKQPIQNLYEKVVLKWYQARDAIGNTSGDKGIIETIVKYPVKIFFDTDTIKADIIGGSENIFRFLYIVDVEVITIEDRPVLYKIKKFYEKYLP